MQYSPFLGRKSDPNISESFEELHSVRSADRKAKEQKIKKQWDNLHKLVPVCK
jgi:hypothetical protein